MQALKAKQNLVSTAVMDAAALTRKCLLNCPERRLMTPTAKDSIHSQ